MRGLRREGGARQYRQGRRGGMDHTLQVRLLSCLCKLLFPLLKTTAVIPFTVLVHGVNRVTVLDGLEASRTLLVLKIVGKPHTKSPRFFSFTPVRNKSLVLLLGLVELWASVAYPSVCGQREALSIRCGKGSSLEKKYSNI